MKNHYFLVVAMLCNFLTFGQNYRLLNKNLIAHYKVLQNYETPVYTAKVDSVSFDGTDSTYFMNRYVSDFNSCLTTNSLLSDKIIIKNDGTQLLLNSGDTITIKNSNSLNEIWKVFTFPYDNSYLEAKYISKTFSTFLGISDSVKNYKIFRRNAAGVLMTSPFNSDTLKISKHYGITQGYEFLAFWGYPYSYDSKLISIEGLDEQYKPKSYADIFDFEIGDIFHRHIIDEYRDEYSSNYDSYYYVTSNQNDSVHLKVLDKQINSTSIVYKFLREINQVIDTVSTTIYTNQLVHESGAILKNFTLDSLMNYFSYDALTSNPIIPISTFGLDYAKYYTGSENNSINIDTTCFDDVYVADYPYYYHTELGEKLGVINFNKTKTEEYSDGWSYWQYYTTIYEDALKYSLKGGTQKGAPLFNKITSNKINTCDGEVTFSSNYANAISYLWDFGDGTSSTDMNPTHIYTAENDYSVSLTMVTHFGTYTLNLANQINVGDYTIANFPSFSISLNETCNTYTVSDLSNPIGPRTWDFGGIETSTDSTETYTFVPGNNAYITLTISQQFCNFIKTVQVDIDTTTIPTMALCSANNLEELVQNLYELKINSDAIVTPGRVYPANYFVNACKYIELDTLSFELLSAIGSEYSYYEPGIGQVYYYDQSDYSFWLDLNDNGEFSSDENIFMMPAYSDTYVFTNTNQINIPNSTIRNKNLRLRLVVNSLTDPCAGNRYDFSMKITAPIIDASLIESDLYGNKLFPNPSNGDFNYFVSNPKMINSVTIVNELGQELYHTNHIDTEMNIILQNASSGIYFMKTNGVKGLETIKFVIE